MRAFRVWPIFAAALLAAVPFAGEAPAQDWSTPMFPDPRANEALELFLLQRDPGRDFVRGSAVYRLGRPADAATRWAAAAEESGDTQAAREVALSFFLGDGVRLDLEAAANWARWAGPRADDAEASAWKELFDRAGYRFSFALLDYYLSERLKRGHPPPLPLDERRAAAAAGERYALADMAMLHYAPRRLASEDILEALAGEPVPPPAVPGWLLEEDLFLALAYFERAADAGNALAARIRGVLAERGMGGIPSYSRAIAWYRLAADLGDHEALLRVIALVGNPENALFDEDEAARLCLGLLGYARQRWREAPLHERGEAAALYDRVHHCLMRHWEAVPESARRRAIRAAQHDAARPELEFLRDNFAYWHTFVEPDGVAAVTWALLKFKAIADEYLADPDTYLTRETLGHYGSFWWGRNHYDWGMSREAFLAEVQRLLAAAAAGDHRPLFERAEPFLPPPPWAEE